MGSANQKACEKCNHICYDQCQRCSISFPLRSCPQCIRSKESNIKINMEFDLMNKLYQDGQVLSLKAYESRVASSRMPKLWKQNVVLHHCLLQLRVEIGAERQIEVVYVDCDRDPQGMVNVLFYDSYQQKFDIGKQVKIEKTPFKNLVNYVQNDWHTTQYDRYERNCYDFVVDLIEFLDERVPAKVITQIHKQKDKQIKKFWD